MALLRTISKIQHATYVILYCLYTTHTACHYLQLSLRGSSIMDAKIAVIGTTMSNIRGDQLTVDTHKTMRAAEDLQQKTMCQQKQVI